MEYISHKVAICSLWTVCPCLYSLSSIITYDDQTNLVLYKSCAVKKEIYIFSREGIRSFAKKSNIYKMYIP